MTYIDKFEVVTPQDFLRRHIEAVRDLAGRKRGSLTFAMTPAKAGESSELFLTCDAGKFRTVQIGNTEVPEIFEKAGPGRARTVWANMRQAFFQLLDKEEVAKADAAEEDTALVLAAMGLNLPGHMRLYVPSVPGMNWSQIVADESQHISIAKHRAYAARYCSEGHPTIAILGATDRRLAELVRLANAHARKRKDLN